MSTVFRRSDKLELPQWVEEAGRPGRAGHVEDSEHSEGFVFEIAADVTAKYVKDESEYHADYPADERVC
jgi:hypothetical protein